MATNDPWLTIQAELDQILANEEYKPFRPLLDMLQVMVNAKHPHPDAAEGLLHTVKQLHAEMHHGANIRERVEHIASGYIEPGWNVAGNVNQANRDLVYKTIITVFQNIGNQLEL